MWVRGLKQDLLVAAEGDGMSHPVWVRGLKLTNIAIYLKIEHVAPRVGAWIETFVKRKLFHKRYTYVMKYIFYGT